MAWEARAETMKDQTGRGSRCPPPAVSASQPVREGQRPQQASRVTRGGVQAAAPESGDPGM